MKNLIVLFLIFGSFATLAQEDDVKKLEKQARRYIDDEAWHLALPILLNLDQLNPGNTDYSYLTGVCYYHTIDKKESLQYFKRAAQRGDTGEDLSFYLGRSYHFNNLFDSAIMYYEMYREEVVEKDGENDERVPIIDKHIESCIIGSILVQDSIELEIINIGSIVNSEYPDYVPVLPGDESFMMFTSRRPDNMNAEKDADGQYFEDIFITNKNADGSWSAPSNLGETINTWQHDACIGLSFDGTKLFIYKSVNGGDIYMSEKSGGVWKKPERLQGEVNSKYWESSACLAADGKTLYYTSDRPGGFGGSDIYKAELRADGTWGNSVNLGPQINTEFDEDAPHIHYDGKTLFFSSRGHETMGGFDIFAAVWEESANSWTKAENIGYPINTADEDIYFALSTDGARAFFSSYRPDTFGEKDLYYLQRPDNDPGKYQLKVRLFADNEVPSEAIITITDGSTEIDRQISDAFSEKHLFTLSFDKEYLIMVSVAGFTPVERELNVTYRPDIFEQNLHLRLTEQVQSLEEAVATNGDEDSFGKEDSTPIENEANEKAVREEVVNSDDTGSEFEDIDLRIVNFEFDKIELSDDAKAFLSRLANHLNNFPERTLEISGYTDVYGPAKYNLYLSKLRAQTAYDYLVKAGIDPKRMNWEGYGEANPIADNAIFEERKKNRRVEFKFSE